jgi:hypothetical protein
MNTVPPCKRRVFSSIALCLLIVQVLCITARAADAVPPRVLTETVHNYIYRNITDVVSDETFRFALQDLNGDGRADAIVLLTGREWCGSGGCTMLIFMGAEDGYSFVSKITITSPPIRISNNRVRGWRTLIVSSKGKGNVALRLNKSFQYPTNPSMQPKATRAEVDAADIAIQ